MNYEIIESEIDPLQIKRTDADGKVWWIPTDPNNSDYAQYLRYTAWVDAGNDPDEFWAQTEI